MDWLYYEKKINKGSRCGIWCNMQTQTETNFSKTQITYSRAQVGTWEIRNSLFPFSRAFKYHRNSFFYSWHLDCSNQRGWQRKLKKFVSLSHKVSSIRERWSILINMFKISSISNVRLFFNPYHPPSQAMWDYSSTLNKNYP